MISALEALARLREGNRRFVSDECESESLTDTARRMKLTAGQKPFAVILGCSDSRVPAELVFDQGLGDLFVIRVAGNVIAPSLVASVEFAAEAFGTRLVVVLGHTQCGAVTATLNALRASTPPPPPNLDSIVNRVRPAVESLFADDPDAAPETLIEEAVRANIRASAAQLRNDSPILSRLIAGTALSSSVRSTPSRPDWSTSSTGSRTPNPMSKERAFLTAEWRNLLMLNYEVDGAILQSRVPRGCELDTWDGRHFVSIVGFLFLDTRVRGIPIPFHRNFEEVNLRFYVRRRAGDAWRRGVVFIKELVPRWAIAAVARGVYGENYEVAADAPYHRRTLLLGLLHPALRVEARRPLAGCRRPLLRDADASRRRCGGDVHHRALLGVLGRARRPNDRVRGGASALERMASGGAHLRLRRRRTLRTGVRGGALGRAEHRVYRRRFPRHRARWKKTPLLMELHSDLQRIEAADLAGFFVGWPNPPSPGAHRRLLEGSGAFVVAVEPGTTRVVGYATALTDGILSAYISHLEVLPEFRGRGIGSNLVRALLERIGDLYMIDVVCDEDVQPFYERLGLQRWNAMIRRKYDAQGGR